MTDKTSFLYEPIDLCACFDPVFDPPAEQLTAWGFSVPEPTLENTAFYTAAHDGTQYFYCGNTRIRITEHFASQGKAIEHFIEDAIQFTAAKSKTPA